ncbi:MAG: penicillin-binding protein 2 [Alphaproteobacteria bacterium]|nr:penicillin-binding protein 2 [Alphaproteobacteria bacterium]
MNSSENEKVKVLGHRTIFLMLFNLVAFAMIVARLYYLQVYEADKYKVMSDKNRISTRFLVPPRGVIYDRNGEVIAKNDQDFQALLIAEQTSDINQTLEAFKNIIPLTVDEETRILKDIKNKRRFIPIKLKNDLSWEEVAKIELNAPDLPGVEINEGLSRIYPYADLYAHVLGYVGPISDADKKDNPLAMVPGFKIGKAGLERTLDYQLQGKGGTVKLEVNAYGRVMKEIERNSGVQGDSVQITVDSRLQEAAYEAFGEESGAAVVLDVRTGEILALVSKPSFDPNLFTNGISYKHWNALLNNERTPLVDKAVSGQYSPGSTFKVVVALAALEAGVINVGTRIYCAGGMDIGNIRFHCWKHAGHGSLNVVEALKYSCDIFFYETALRVGIDKIHDMALQLGLGEPLHVGLDNEKGGLIPSKAWKKARFDKNWTPGDAANSGIGQGYVLVTPLQLATMLARVVNGGYAVQPTFIKPTEADLKKIKRLDISTRHIELVKQGMFEVVNGAGGTAGRAKFNIDGAVMGGKTGTTQVRRISMKERLSGIIRDEQLPWKLRNHAWFMGFTPVDNPRYAVAVIVEHGSSGSGVAAPIASKILQKALELNIK